MNKVIDHLKKIQPMAVGSSPTIYGIASYFPEFQIGTGSGVNLDRADSKGIADLIFTPDEKGTRPYNEYIETMRILDEQGQAKFDEEVRSTPDSEPLWRRETRTYDAPEASGETYRPRASSYPKPETVAASAAIDEMASTTPVRATVEPLEYVADEAVEKTGRFGPGPEMKGMKAIGSFIADHPRGLALAGLGVLAVAGVAAVANQGGMGAPGGPVVPPGSYEYDPNAFYGDIAGANYEISATSNKPYSQDEIAGMISNTVQETGYAGKANVNVSHTNNATKLDRIFYRDTVAQYL
jgi:hypothetical protein